MYLWGPKFSLLTLSCLVVAIVGIYLPMAQSKLEDGMIIQQIINKEGGEICVGVTVPASCPVNCFRPDPVCGVDGVTYWCGCADAMCNGTPVSKLGPCELGNGGASLPHQALLLVHILWLILLGFSLLFGLF